MRVCPALTFAPSPLTRVVAISLPVGSRVILEIPPADGYGEQGNEQAGIKGTDTLFFVVDILKAS